MTDTDTAPDDVEDEDVAEDESQEDGDEDEGCSVLSLDLGPLDVDLFGLRIQLNETDLDVTAESGQRKLLGNLLCAIAGLLSKLEIPDALRELLQRLWDFVRNLLQRLGIGRRSDDDEEDAEG